MKAIHLFIFGLLAASTAVSLAQGITLSRAPVSEGSGSTCPGFEALISYHRISDG